MMPIKDDEKRRAYFRDLMRKRRAAIAREPKPRPVPDVIDVLDMDRHLDMPDRPAWVEQFIAEASPIDRDSDQGIIAAFAIFHRHRAKARTAHRNAQKAKREEDARLEAERKAQWEIDKQRCSFCRQLPSADRIIIEEGYDRICEHCAQRHVTKLAAIRTGEREIKRCSFCGKLRSEVRTLVRGLDGVCICDACIPEVAKVMDEHQGAAS
jgi:hypothetical protein